MLERREGPGALSLVRANLILKSKYWIIAVRTSRIEEN